MESVDETAETLEACVLAQTALLARVKLLGDPLGGGTGGVLEGKQITRRCYRRIGAFV